MCCGVTSEGLVVRVGPEGRAGALAEAHVRPMEFGGRAMAGFVLVEPEGFRDDAALEAWVRRGIAFVLTLPAKAPAGRKRSRER